MRILYLAAGAAGMYCGSCTRDLALVRELSRMGHDVTVMPLYTPIKTDSLEELDVGPIFYGGINVYLQQLNPSFSKLPGFIHNLLDLPSLLEKVSGWGIKSDPASLAPLTISVLEGGDGRQKEELDRLIRFIEKQPPFDLVNITNSLLSGLAPELKKRLRCPIVCNVQGEENFLEAMGAEVLSEARKLIRQNAREIDLFVASSQAYARKMIEFLGVAPARIVPVEAGIDCEPFTRDTPRPHHPFTIGYLSAITPGKGLDILVEAVSTLVIRDKREVFLKIGGKVLDKKYWKETMALADSSGIGPRVEYIGEPDDKGKAEFLKSLSVFVQPSRVRESRGIAALEAMAAGTPLIAPASGVFPEIIENTKGGVSFFSGDSEGIGNRLLDMLDDPAFADRLGENAAKGVREIYSASGMAAKVADLYARLISGELKSTGTDIIPKDLSARDRSEPVGE